MRLIPRLWRYQFRNYDQNNDKMIFLFSENLMHFTTYTSCRKSKFGVFLRVPRPILSQYMSQNIYKERLCECTKGSETWSQFYAL